MGEIKADGDGQVLTVHRAERSDTLARALAEVLATPLDDPFAREVIAVPAKGVERWLSQQLSSVLGAVTTDGIAANIEFPSPSRLVDDIVAVASGIDADTDPWAAGRVLWKTLEVIDSSIHESWCSVLARHLGLGSDDHRAGRRYATAAHLADLFRSYGADRPAMLIEWSDGLDTDGAGKPIDPDQLWQAQLWRALRSRIGSPSPAERLASAGQRLRDEPGLSDLPTRLSLFGPTRLTTGQLAVIDALAANRDVHLWLPHPSAAMWDRFSGGQPSGVVRRNADTGTTEVTNPLLASLARDNRELQQRLAPIATADIWHVGSPGNDTLLCRIQADIRADRAPSPIVQLDGTVQIHACHGPSRQVEVLREALLHLFQADPTLEPRDVVVMCPDVETYAPLITAAFGQGVLGHPGHRLRVRLADRNLRQTNPLLELTATLLNLADGRVTASQVLDLAASGPVRQRFGFSDDDMDRLREWSGQAGARWGIGKRQRDLFGLGEFAHNTWNTALDRVLLGVTADETELSWLGQALPLDDVDSNDIDLAGRVTEYVDRLAVVLRDLQGPQPANAWTAGLSRALDLLTDVAQAEVWQLAQARREFAAATQDSGSPLLRLADVRSMLSRRLAGRPTRANFRTGELTVCTMVPMRSVPHRVVALLGLDDEIFPRGSGVDGDDVLWRDPCVGERDPRSEDRQLLLDAVMSAGEHLLICYTGADPITGATRPPAIPLSELLDVVVATVGAPQVSAVLRRHPLQPFDPRNFAAPAPFSFDRSALAGARASQLVKVPEPPFLSGPLEKSCGDVELADLIAFIVHPTQAFLRQRLGVRVPDADDDVLDALSAELDGLQKWDIGERMLAARLSGVSIADFRQAEWRRGTLPPLRLGATVLDDVERAVQALALAALSVQTGPPETLDVAVDLGDGRRLTGSVTGVYGSVIAAASYSSLAAKHRLGAWARLLAVAAGRPGSWRAVTTGRGQFRTPVSRSTLIAPTDPADQLRRLVELRDRGLREPLPIATAAAEIYAGRRLSGSSVDEAREAAEKEWSGMYGERKDRHIGYLHGQSATFGQLWDGLPLVDEQDWATEPSRFGVLAIRLWAPLLAAESVVRP